MSECTADGEGVSCIDSLTSECSADGAQNLQREGVLSREEQRIPVYRIRVRLEKEVRRAQCPVVTAAFVNSSEAHPRLFQLAVRISRARAGQG